LIERIECDPPWFVEAKFADVPESLWQRIEPLIPRSGRNREAGGLPWLRVVMAGIVYRLKPPKFFCTRRRRPLPCRARRRRVRHKGGGKARAGSARSRAQAGHAARYRDRRSARRLPSTRARAEQAGGGQHYEEYHPYGSTAFHAASAASEVSAKRYRYTSKERDEETGFTTMGRGTTCRGWGGGLRRIPRDYATVPMLLPILGEIPSRFLILQVTNPHHSPSRAPQTTPLERKLTPSFIVVSRACPQNNAASLEVARQVHFAQGFKRSLRSTIWKYP
jgi:hypothetical protein